MGRPYGQTQVRLPSQCRRSCQWCPSNICCGLVAVRPPTSVGETEFGAVEGRWRPSLAAGRRGNMGMPRIVYPEGFGMDEVGETAKVGELPQGNEEAAVVSTLPVLRVSWDSRVEVLLLCGVTVAPAPLGEMPRDLNTAPLPTSELQTTPGKTAEHGSRQFQHR
jgi:hypothetical protein